MQEYIKKGDKINAKVVKHLSKVGGEIKSMSNNNSSGFSNKQLEQLSSLMDFKLKPIVDRLDQVDKRLDNLEKDVKVLKENVNLIKNTPTMQRELDNKN